MTFCFNEKKNSRLVLVGSMGAGKTTIGKILAARMELPFFDTDDIVYIGGEKKARIVRQTPTKTVFHIIDTDRKLIVPNVDLYRLMLYQ